MTLRILFLVPYTPSLIRTRPYNLLRELMRQGHQVTLATLWENDEEFQFLHKLDSAGVQVISEPLTRSHSARNAIGAIPSSTPLQAVYCWHPGLLRSVLRRLEQNPKFDIVHIEHLRGVRYGLHIKHFSDHLPIIWDSVDCISYLFAQAAQNSASPFGRVVSRLELGRTRSYEAWLMNQFDQVLVTSAVDKTEFENLGTRKRVLQPAAEGGPSKITVLPNGVDLTYFSPVDRTRKPETLAFSGKMSYHANATAAVYLVNDIMPLVWRERPGVRVWIVGKDPPSQVRQLAQRNPRVTVTGTVSDLRPYLQGASTTVAPIKYGAGIQNKVLEAMACATPVVATPQAVSALRTIGGTHLLVSQAPDEFARCVLDLLSDSELATRVGNAGRKYVEEYHPWGRIAAELGEIYQRAIDARTRKHLGELAPR